MNKQPLYATIRGKITTDQEEATWESSLRCNVYLSYEELVKRLGEPNHTQCDDIFEEREPAGEKIRVTWFVITPYGWVTVYDYKETAPVNDITMWSVGGFSDEAAQWFCENVLKLAHNTEATSFQPLYVDME